MSTLLNTAVSKKASATAGVKVGAFNVGCTDTLHEKTGEKGYAGWAVPGKGQNRWYRDTLASVCEEYLKNPVAAADLPDELKAVAAALGADLLLAYIAADKLQTAKKVTHPRKEKKDKPATAATDTLAAILGS